MIKIQGKIPRNILVACSGGADSMAVVDFLRRNHNIEVIYLDHRTAHAHDAWIKVLDYSRKHGIPYHKIDISRPIDPKRSLEEQWREWRYKTFKHIGEPIITCHHLDDCVETWLFKSMHGHPTIIPYRNENVFRPFRLNRKRDLELWAQLHGVDFFHDPSNDDTRFMRNYIRHVLMPHALTVNPGLHKVIMKKVLLDEPN